MTAKGVEPGDLVINNAGTWAGVVVSVTDTEQVTVLIAWMVHSFFERIITYNGVADDAQIVKARRQNVVD